jgi:peptide/nickel transport system permease protein
MRRLLAWTRSFLGSHRAAQAGATMIALIVAIAAIGPLLAPYDAMRAFDEPSALPSAEHLLGTDSQGRDVLSRIVYGARVTLLIALTATLMSAVLGTLVGAVAGYAGGAVDLLLMRTVDFAMSFPSFLLAMVTVAVLGKDLRNVIVAVGLVGAPLFARQLRAEVIRVASHDYVLAARAIGASPTRVLLRHVLPNTIAPLIVLLTLGMGSAILDVAGLNFLGLGGDPYKTPEWGMILYLGWQDHDKGTIQVIAAGLAIFITVLGFNLLGDGLRDELDPKVSGRGR